MLSKICAIIARTLMFVTPVLAGVWSVRVVMRKTAAPLGIAALICAVCFVLSVMVGAFSDPNSNDRIAAVVFDKTEGKNVVPEDRTVEEIKKSYEKDVKSFSSKRKVSLELAQSIKDSMEHPNIPFSFDEINGWEQTEDWASGERYQAWHYNAHEDKYYYLLIYTKGDRVVSIYDTTDGRKLIYESETVKPEAEHPDDAGIRLADGLLGDYGKSVNVSGQSYIWYSVPSGKYEVVSEGKYGTVFVVSDTDSNDVRGTLQFQSSGETGEIVVEEGTHIELSMNSAVVLTAK